MRRLTTIAVVLAFCCATAHAATRSWTGAVDGTWSNAGNWDTGVPQNGDDLVFAEGPAVRAVTNDLPPEVAFGTVTISGASYSIGGNTVKLVLLVSLADDTVVHAPLALIGTDDLQLDVAGGSLAIHGEVSASEPLVVALGGRLRIAHPRALGAGPAEVRVSGGKLTIDDVDVAATVAFRVDSSTDPVLIEGEGNASLHGDFFLGYDHSTLSLSSSNGTLTLDGRIWTQKIEFGEPFVYVRVSGPGAIVLNHATELHGLAWDSTAAVTFGPGTRLSTADVFNELNRPLHIAASASLSLNGSSAWIGILTGSGSLDLGGGRLTLAKDFFGGGGQFDGTIAGPGLVDVRRPMIFTGDLTGFEIANFSSIDVRNRKTTAPPSIRNWDSESFGCDYWVSCAPPRTELDGAAGDTFIEWGTLIPGFGDRAVSPSTQNLTLVARGGYVERLNGTPLGEYGRLEVHGTVTLGDAALTIETTTLFPAGTTFAILENDGTDSISGTFAGAPEGGSVAGPLQNFTITYAGGDGNDIALTVLGIPVTLTLSASPMPIVAGAPVTLTATVQSGGPSLASIAKAPGGTVTFFDGTTSLGETAVVDGSASLTVTLGGGFHNLTAVYSGDSTFAAATSAVLVAEAHGANIPALDVRALALLAALIALVALRALR